MASLERAKTALVTELARARDALLTLSEECLAAARVAGRAIAEAGGQTTPPGDA